MDMIDINIRPRGVLPMWIIVSVLFVLAKVFGLPLSWLAALSPACIGGALLILLLLYGVLEAAQKDMVWLGRRARGEDHEDGE